MTRSKNDSAAAALSPLLGPLRRAVLRATRTVEGLPDLPEAHIEILRTVAAQPGITAGGIAERLGLARPTVSNLIQALKRDGLLTLDRGERDARVVHVSATDRAADLLSRYDGASRRIVAEALAQLTAEDRAAITAAVPALARLQAILSAPAAEPTT